LLSPYLSRLAIQGTIDILTATFMPRISEDPDWASTTLRKDDMLDVERQFENCKTRRQVAITLGLLVIGSILADSYIHPNGKFGGIHDHIDRFETWANDIRNAAQDKLPWSHKRSVLENVPPSRQSTPGASIDSYSIRERFLSPPGTPIIEPFPYFNQPLSPFDVRYRELISNPMQLKHIPDR
jgi:hypothetical protein